MTALLLALVLAGSALAVWAALTGEEAVMTRSDPEWG